MMLRVKKNKAEAAIRELAARRLVNTAQKISRKGDFVSIPLRGEPPGCIGEVISGEGTPRPEPVSPHNRILEKSGLPRALAQFIPDKWEQHGNVVVVQFPEKLESYKYRIARAFASELGADTVIRDLAGIRGVLREPDVEILLGEKTECVHLENRIRYIFDASKIMFSSGNLAERIRMGEAVRTGETAVDMFAGIGYFTLPMAVHGRADRVFACELNPVSYSYLQKNIRLNKVLGRVTPLPGDCRETAPEGVADRVVLGHFDSMQFLPKAVRVLRPDGGMLHIHLLCNKKDLKYCNYPGAEKIIRASGGYPELVRVINVKSFKPNVWHIVLDVKVGFNRP